MPGKKIRAVIFDMDGTLLNTLPDLEHSINSVLKRRGLPTHAPEAIRSFVGSGIKVAVERALVAGGSHAPDTLDAALVSGLAAEIATVYAADPVGRTGLYDGMGKLLDILAVRRVPMCILSNKPDKLVQPIAAELLSGWAFIRVDGQVDGTPRKPDPGCALDQARAMGARPEEVLFLGDSEIDVQTARNAGMLAVGVSWGFRDRADLEIAGADVIVDHPAEVLTLIAG